MVKVSPVEMLDLRFNFTILQIVNNEPKYYITETLAILEQTENGIYRALGGLAQNIFVFNTYCTLNMNLWYAYY